LNQQSQLATRLENLIWRHLVPHFEEKLFGSDSPETAVEKKFDAVQKNFQKFFDAKQPFGTPQDSYVEIYEKIEEILPTFFKQVIGVAPKRRVAAILVHTCLDMPFTENELLMHCVSHEMTLLFKFVCVQNTVLKNYKIVLKWTHFVK